jgi:hypothetical protein
MPHAETRERLIDMRKALLADMDRQIEAGSLVLLAGIGAALAAIDGEAGAAERAGRAVVSDDGQIRPAVYRDDGEPVAVMIAPVRAVALAGELVAAALPKLSR